MKNVVRLLQLKHFLSALYILIIILAGYSCSNKDNVTSPETPNVVSDNNSISGTINFVDTNFTILGGIYIVGAYTTWPTFEAPASFDTIRINRNSTTGEWNKSYSFKIKNLSNGSYSISTGFRNFLNGYTNVQGIYGCDTSHNDCVLTNTTKVNITNNSGVSGINISSWANKTKQLEDFNIAKINGSIRFVDTLFAPLNGTYLIAAHTSWPPSSAPTVFDSLRLSRNSISGQWNKTYTFQLNNIPIGNITLTVIYRRLTGGASPIMGIFGCDTVHYSSTSTCPLFPTQINIQRGTRTFNRDFLSWADTTKRIF